MKSLITVLALFSLLGCGERVKLSNSAPTSSNPVSCDLELETDTTATFVCSDGTSITIEKPERIVEVPVIVEVPIEVCTDSKIFICVDGKTIATSLSALEGFKGGLIGACKDTDTDDCDDNDDGSSDEDDHDDGSSDE